MWVPGGVSGAPRHEITIFSHFGHDQSSPGLSLVPTGIIKPRNLLKKSCQNVKGEKQMVIR